MRANLRIPAVVAESRGPDLGEGGESRFRSKLEPSFWIALNGNLVSERFPPEKHVISNQIFISCTSSF